MEKGDPPPPQDKEGNRTDVISYGHRLPGIDGKYLWLGIHPVALVKKRLHRYLESCKVDGAVPEVSEEEAELTPYDDDALSIVFLKLCEAITELAHYTALPSLEKHSDAEQLMILPGVLAEKMVRDAGGAFATPVPHYREPSTGKVNPVPWLLPFPESDEDGPAPFFHGTSYAAKLHTQCIRTSSWIVSGSNHDVLVRAMMHAAYMYAGLVKASNFELDGADIPQVDVTRLTKDPNDTDHGHLYDKCVFSIAWVLRRGSAADSTPKPVFTPRQRIIADMVTVKEALVAPEGSVIDRAAETIKLPAEPES